MLNVFMAIFIVVSKFVVKCEAVIIDLALLSHLIVCVGGGGDLTYCVCVCVFIAYCLLSQCVSDL